MSYRDTGFYWIKLRDHDYWTVGWYYGADSLWRVVGEADSYTDEAVEVVGPEISEYKPAE